MIQPDSMDGGASPLMITSFAHFFRKE